MSEKIAIITGAGRGIGRATAIELSRRDFRPVLVSRTQSELEESAAMCANGLADIFPADISVADQIEALVARILAKHQRVYALIHCAGVAPMHPIEELTADDWQSIVDTNLSPVIHFARLLWPIWRQQGGGVMVNVSSEAARDPYVGLGAYGAAKAGVNLLGLALAREGAPFNIRVHTVAPGATETAMLRSILSHEQFPSEKTLDPSQVARVIVQCVTGDLFCTSGEVIYVHKNQG